MTQISVKITETKKRKHSLECRDACVRACVRMCCVQTQISRGKKKKTYEWKGWTQHVDADGGRSHVDMQMHCVWTQISINKRKKKKKKKELTWVLKMNLCVRAGEVVVFVLRHTLCVHVDMDRCKGKTKRKEKTYL